MSQHIHLSYENHNSFEVFKIKINRTSSFPQNHAKHGKARKGKAWLGKARHGSARQGVTKQDKACLGKARRG
jgi:hypothetical protein